MFTLDTSYYNQPWEKGGRKPSQCYNLRTAEAAEYTEDIRGIEPERQRDVKYWIDDSSEGMADEAGSIESFIRLVTKAKK
uniref:Uncharacterized protein n=1 Tax=Pristionchus pacificus TaxID=54126 RepID=A0A2A6CC91_PRIPA|eukprot:PDM75663.1 hypothetical protein PRIPAC_42840 [Pristionchus pacificus]